MTSDGPAALYDLKVVELGTMVTAPLAGMMLGQLGAQVIKVERPGGGDPFRKTTGGSYSPNYIAYNQNKKSIVLDIAKDPGRQQLLDLIGWADVLIENFRPGVLTRLGFTASVMQKRNPRLIHCSITGFGAEGPYSKRPAYDTVGLALSGLLDLYLDRNSPQILGPTLCDNITGMFACNGVLAALHARDKTGQPQRVEVNMLECSITLLPDAMAYLNRNIQVFGPLSRAAASQCFVCHCADGRQLSIHISVQEKFWLAFVDAIGLPHLSRDDRFATRPARIRNYIELGRTIEEVVRTKPRDYWEKILADAEIPHAPVHSLAEVQNDPQVRFLETFGEADHPTEGRIVGARNPIRINGMHAEIGAPPALGEHTAEIIESLLKKLSTDVSKS